VSVACAGLLLAGAYLAGRSLDDSSRRRLEAEAERAARDAAARAKDALAAQAESVAVMAHNAVANPPLVAALRARVDRRTLGDLFASESWWAPYRFFDSAVSYDGSAIAFAQPGARGLPLERLVAQARAGGALVSTVLAGEARVHLASAVPIPLGAAQPPAVLVLTRPLDHEALRGLAERAGGAVLVLEGQRPLGRHGDDPALLDAALERPGRRDPARAASSLRLAPGLSLWVGTSVSDLARSQARADRGRKAVLWGVAGLLSLLILVTAFRRPRALRDMLDRRSAASAGS